MKPLFTSQLADALHDFLEFKRRRGYRYNRSEHTLRSFDRFLASRASEDPACPIDKVILAWLANRPNRLAVSVSQDMAVIRQFWLYLRRTQPRRYRHDVHWPKLPTQSTFTPHVLSKSDVHDLLRLASKLERPRFRSALYRALLLVMYCTGLRFGEALRLRVSGSAVFEGDAGAINEGSRSGSGARPRDRGNRDQESARERVAGAVLEDLGVGDEGGERGL